MTLKHARSNSSYVTVIACIQLDIIFSLIIALTFVLAIKARGQTQLLLLFFYNIQDVFRIEGLLKVFIFGAMCAVFFLFFFFF